jgi:diguanylate cyclase (GGDEF)-like protein
VNSTPITSTDSAWGPDERLRLQQCAAEPLRTPGRIQAFGTLLAVDAQTGTIVVTSDDATQWLGRPLSEAGDDTLTWAFSHGLAIDPVRVVFDGERYDAVVHRGSNPVIIELEPGIPDLEYVRTGVVTAIQRLAGITDSIELRRRAAAEIKAITGFDRVMCYHFFDDGHGEIVADEREPDMEPYLGLHFPASDIPPQARALYLEKRSRAIVDTADEPKALSALLPEMPPLDLTATEMRAVSPHHLQFMRNMGQAATFSLSLVVDDRLVGMFTCAHRTVRRLPVLLRRSLEVLASQVAMQLAAAAQIEELQRQLTARERRAAVIAPLYGALDVHAALLDGTQTVLDAIPADGAFLRINGTARTIGTVPSQELLEAVIDELGPSPFVTESLPIERPELAVEIPGVAGILCVPLGDDGDCLAFVRGEVAQEVSWLGDQSATNRDHALSPRRSFSAWKESVTGRSAPWGDLVKDASDFAADICSAIDRRNEAELAELAFHDALTGLHNRRYLDDRLEELLRDTERGVAMVFVDLDDFKLVNDTHGHEAGDAVLMAVSKRLAHSARADDIVVRLGGDEFILVCRDVTEEDAQRIAERALQALSEPVVVEEIEIRVTASAGVVAAGEQPTASELLEAADAAMYRAKRSGRGRVSR